MEMIEGLGSGRFLEKRKRKRKGRKEGRKRKRGERMQEKGKWE